MEEFLSHYHFLEKLKAFPFVEAIYLFGSRARGDSLERADIDLAVDCPSASPREWETLLEVIDDADTLLSIDCIRMDQIENPWLQEAIAKEGKLLYSRHGGGDETVSMG